jgi:cytidine deaminase
VKYKRLINHAQKAKRHSYSPHSNFRVGAAIVTKDGKIYSGCNIENSSYSLTICAERTAIFKAISEGHRKFSAIAITSDLKEEIPPCGACRQVLFDLAGNIDVIMVGENNSTKTCKLIELLPIPFDSSMLKNK